MNESTILSIINLLKDIPEDMYDTYLFENARDNCSQCAALINAHITELKPNEHAFVDEFLDTYSGILKKYTDYLISIDDRGIAKNHKPSIDAIFSAAWSIIINDESSCEHPCLDNLIECIYALWLAYTKLYCIIHINDMYENLKTLEYSPNSVNIVYFDIGKLLIVDAIPSDWKSLADTISKHMTSLKCKCKIIDFNGDDTSRLWIRKYGKTRIRFQWGIDYFTGGIYDEYKSYR